MYLPCPRGCGSGYSGYVEGVTRDFVRGSLGIPMRAKAMSSALSQPSGMPYRLQYRRQCAQVLMYWGSGSPGRRMRRVHMTDVLPGMTFPVLRSRVEGKGRYSVTTLGGLYSVQ